MVFLNHCFFVLNQWDLEPLFFELLEFPKRFFEPLEFPNSCFLNHCFFSATGCFVLNHWNSNTASMFGIVVRARPIFAQTCRTIVCRWLWKLGQFWGGLFLFNAHTRPDISLLFGWRMQHAEAVRTTTSTFWVFGGAPVELTQTCGAVVGMRLW